MCLTNQLAKMLAKADCRMPKGFQMSPLYEGRPNSVQELPRIFHGTTQLRLPEKAHLYLAITEPAPQSGSTVKRKKSNGLYNLYLSNYTPWYCQWLETPLHFIISNNTATNENCPETYRRWLKRSFPFMYCYILASLSPYCSLEEINGKAHI